MDEKDPNDVLVDIKNENYDDSHAIHLMHPDASQIT